MTQIQKVDGLSRSSANAGSAVSINIYNPKAVNSDKTDNPIESVNKAPACPPCVYDCPKASIYEMPKQSIYQVPAEVPSVPPPVVIPPVAEAPVVNAAKPAEVKEEKKEAEKKPEVNEAKPEADKAPEKKVEVKAPEKTVAQLDLNAFISKLINPNFEVQAKAMEAIAEITQKSPEQAKVFVDTKVFGILATIMNKDTTKLAGPSTEQLQIREKILSGKQVTDAETAKANEITPMEQAERNKQYAMYTTALLQKLYVSEIEKMNKAVVPFAEIPGVSEIAKQVKDNSNPVVRASAIDALSYVQRPEYKEDLTKIFAEAQKDKEKFVQQAATKAIEKIAGEKADKPKEQDKK